MWSRNFTQTGSRIALLIGQLIVLILCIINIDYVYLFNILPDKEAKENYKETSCFIISKRLSLQGHLINKFRADFLISYNVNGVQYNRWVSGNGLDMAFSQSRRDQENSLARFNVGGTYPCWYAPDDPQLSILVLRHNWLSTFPLLVPSSIAVIVLYYLFKNVLELISAAPILHRSRR